ncbi:hypothetical protein EON68_01600 [archaeon]|nr:MAG: hypothetical protein EON68_01600 [archaeon]
MRVTLLFALLTAASYAAASGEFVPPVATAAVASEFVTPSLSATASLGDADRVPTLASGEQAPEHLPSLRTGWGVFDEAVLEPTTHLLRTARVTFRGGLQAVRDLLFPEFRSHPNKPGKGSDLDFVQEDEGRADFRHRIATRDALLRWADALQLPTYFERYPSASRYTLAVVVGVIMLIMFMLAKMIASAVARVTMHALFKLTGNPAYQDGPLATEFWMETASRELAEERAAAYAAYSAEQAKKKAAKEAVDAAFSPTAAAAASAGASNTNGANDANGGGSGAPGSSPQAVSGGRSGVRRRHA